MLKKICRLFLGLVVCAGSACVTPTHASSAYPVLLTTIQASGVGGAKDELISFYNNSPNELNITGWCLVNKSGVAFSCFTSDNQQLRYLLPAYSTAVVVSSEYQLRSGRTPVEFSDVYTVTNQSSGSIVGSADAISLVNKAGDPIDTFSWSTALPSGKAWERLQIGSGLGGYVATGLPSDWRVMSIADPPGTQVYYTDMPIVVDVPEDPDPDLEEPELPGDPEVPVEPGGDMLHPIITELLPNPVGSDTRQEFIELYNPSATTELYLEKYTLRVGAALEKSYSLPASFMIPPLGYRVLLYDDVPFTLLNTSSKVRIEYLSVGTGDVVEYSSPADGEAWALVEGSWRYTTQPTPNEPNVASSPSSNNGGGEEVDNDDGDDTAVISSLKPCAANQYRSPETNRCRLVQVASASIPAPCKAGQVRSPTTNRCRNAVATGDIPAACKPGQERNAETNRCRNIVAMTNAGQGVQGTSIQTANTGVSIYMWLTVIGIALMVLGYAGWEWRVEIKNSASRIKEKFKRRQT